MEGDAEYEDHELFPGDVVLVDEILAEVRHCFGAKRDAYRINRNHGADRMVPERVWKEVVRRARKLGYHADMTAPHVMITRRNAQ